jgi:hypothetical protein
MVYFPDMVAKTLIRGIKLLILCILVVKANHYLNVLARVLKLPLFMDTVFTCALAFWAGLIPGLIAVALAAVDVAFREGNAWVFSVCALGEVLLICFLKPGDNPGRGQPARIGRGMRGRPFLSGTAAASFISTFTTLLLLYVAACITVSVLGGLIDFIMYDVLAKNKLYYSPEDTFKIGFLHSGPPLVLTNILSRIPINIVDRFITVFGGFSLSLLVKKGEPALRRKMQKAKGERPKT